jgi:small-conductance mechanosensitive channel
LLPGTKPQEQTEKKKGPDVEVELGSKAREGVDRAKKALAQRFDSFLEREELGFDSETIDNLAPEVARAFERTANAVDALRGSSLRLAVPMFILALFLAALALLDRQAWRAAIRAQARLRTVWWDWFEYWLRVIVLVAGRVAPLLLLVFLSYFPIQAVFGRVGWSQALTSILWLLVGYRALLTWAEASLALGLFEVSDAHAARLSTFARRMLRLVFGALGLVTIAGELGVPEDVQAFLVFCYELALLSVPIYLLFIKSSVIALFPEAEEAGLYRRLRNGLDRYFRAVIVISAALLALRAAGYVNASTFILLRGYGLFLLVMFTVSGASRLRRWIRKRADTKQKDEHRDLFKSIDWALRVGSTLLVLYLSLRMLEVWTPLVIFLKIPLVSLGKAEISAFSILKAGLIFLIAVLGSRFVRAILVIRVFPAFGVEVGVGYAIQTLVNYALIVIGFFIALIALGVNLSAMTVVLASLGVGIGFGLQTITENLISGFILLFGRSVEKGDIISVGETYGQVEAVGARSVLVRTPDNYDMLIPSKEIVGGRIINWSFEDTLIRHRIPVGVSYKARPREVEKVLLEAAAAHPEVMEEPGPEVWLDSFGDSAVNFTLLVYYDCRQITRGRLNGQLNFIIWDALAEHGIEIPFPQRDLHLRSLGFADELRSLGKQGGTDSSD